jgi:hypothetical protein
MRGAARGGQARGVETTVELTFERGELSEAGLTFAVAGVVLLRYMAATDIDAAESVGQALEHEYEGGPLVEVQELDALGLDGGHEQREVLLGDGP